MNIRTFVTILSRNPQYNFPKMRGGSKAVWNFSENSSVLEGECVPKDRNKKVNHSPKQTRKIRKTWQKPGCEVGDHWRLRLKGGAETSARIFPGSRAWRRCLLQSYDAPRGNSGDFLASSQSSRSNLHMFLCRQTWFLTASFSPLTSGSHQRPTWWSGSRCSWYPRWWQWWRWW